MNVKDPEKLFLEKAHDLLDRGTENLGSWTERRLEEIRSQALMAAGEKRARFFPRRRWVLAGSFAMATLAAAFLFWPSPSSPPPPTGEVEDLEIITSQDRIDFYQNLDFYRWLGSKEFRMRPNGKDV
jgi:hypothetical protein